MRLFRIRFAAALLSLSFVLGLAGNSFAEVKTRAEMQTALEDGKAYNYNPYAFYDLMIDLTDSVNYETGDKAAIQASLLENKKRNYNPFVFYDLMIDFTDDVAFNESSSRATIQAEINNKKTRNYNPYTFYELMIDVTDAVVFSDDAPAGIQEGAAVAANNTQFSSGTATLGSYVRRYEKRHWTPKNADYSDFQFTVCNFNVNQNGDNVTNMREQNVQVVMVKDPDGTPEIIRATFGGNNIKVLPVGECAHTDPVETTVVADTEFATRFMHYASDDSAVAPTGVPYRAGYGEGVSASTNELYDLETATFNVVSTEGWGISAIFGQPSVPVNSAFAAGDSIMYGYAAGDSDGVNGNRGVFERAANGEFGILNAAFPSGLAGVWEDETEFTRVFDLIDSLPSGTLTHAIWGGSTNDIAAGIGLATVTGYVENILTRFRDSGMLASAHTLMPYTTSSDDWATEVNQTPRSQFASGAVADQYNEDLLDGTIRTDFPILDGRSFFQGTDTNVWKVLAGSIKSTNDGIHPNAAGLTQAVADGMNADFLKRYDLIANANSLVFDLDVRRDLATVTDTDIVTGTAASGQDIRADTARAPKYDNTGAGFLYSPDTSTELETSTALTPVETRIDIYIFEAGTNPATNEEFLSIGSENFGDDQVSILQTSGGNLTYGQSSTSGYPVISANDNGNSFVCLVLEYVDASDLDVYFNGVFSTSFNPHDDYFLSTREYYHLFSRFSSDLAPVDMKLFRVARINSTLATAGITAGDICDYASDTYNF